MSLAPPTGQAARGALIEFGLQAKPSILYVGFVILAARRDDYDDYRGFIIII